MSTPEIVMLLVILPRALKEHPEWFTGDFSQVARRLIAELRGK